MQLSNGQHLLNNPECTENYRVDWFRIMVRARSAAHLRVLEATLIPTQSLVLCKRIQFVQILRLFGDNCSTVASLELSSSLGAFQP